MRILGIDPDLHAMGIAYLDTESGYIQVTYASVPIKLKGDKALIAMAKCMRAEIRNVCSINEIHKKPNLVIIEKPELYMGASASPKSITDLSIATGIALQSVEPDGITRAILVEPKKWKGQVPKSVKHRRILDEAKIEYHIDPRGRITPFVECLKNIPRPHWTHCIDAIGLAFWGKERAMSQSPNF